MRWIRQNPSLAAGIGLPVLMVLLFALAQLIPQWLVAPPRYSLLFSVREYRIVGNHATRLSVQDGHLKAEYMSKHDGYNESVRLCRFDSATLTTSDISLQPPGGDAPSWWTEFAVPPAVVLPLDTATRAPDGYEFSLRSNDYSSGPGDLIFSYGSAYGMQMPVITNGGRVIPLINGNRFNAPYSSHDVTFLGWLVPEQQP